MAAFDYTALNESGKQVSGVLEADGSRQVSQLLKDKGWIPLAIDESNRKHKTKKFSQWLSPSISARDLSLITRQMSTLVQAGLPLEEALAGIAKQSKKPKISSMVLTVRSKVLEGYDISTSLAEYPRAFNKLYRSTIAAGEQSGYLDKVLLRLADYVESSYASQQKIMMAMLYPAILMVLSIGVVVALMTYVVPDVVEVFVDNGQQLPALTHGLIAVSDFVSSYGAGLLIGMMFMVAGICYAYRYPPLRLLFDRLFLNAPLLSLISRGSNTARFTNTLSILVNSGVPIVDAMHIAGEVLSNQWLKHEVDEATQKVQQGTSLSKSLDESGYFPPIMIQMIESGEAGGELADMLARVAKNQEDEMNGYITVLLGLLEPLMLILMGGCVLVIVLAIMLPILNLNQLVS